MKKFRAFNYIELSVAMVIIGIVFVILLQIVKPTKNNQNMHFIAAWDNLMKANEELVYMNEQNGGSGLPVDYCSQLVELLSLKSSTCASGKIVFQNGVEIEDLTDSWPMSPRTEFFDLSVKRNGVTHKLRVYQADGMVVPLVQNGVNFVISDSTDIFKFRVQNRETMEFLPETTQGVSFHDAVCYMRGNNNYGINNCGNMHNTEKCPYPASCDIKIVMPKGKNFI